LKRWTESSSHQDYQKTQLMILGMKNYPDSLPYLVDYKAQEEEFHGLVKIHRVQDLSQS